MYVQLTMAERLKDLRVIDKKLTLEQLAATSITMPFRSWQNSMAYPPIISWA